MKYYKIEIVKGYIATIEACSKGQAKNICQKLRAEFGTDVTKLSYVKKAAA